MLLVFYHVWLELIVQWPCSIYLNGHKLVHIICLCHFKLNVSGVNDIILIPLSKLREKKFYDMAIQS